MFVASIECMQINTLKVTATKLLFTKLGLQRCNSYSCIGHINVLYTHVHTFNCTQIECYTHQHASKVASKKWHQYKSIIMGRNFVILSKQFSKQFSQQKLVPFISRDKNANETQFEHMHIHINSIMTSNAYKVCCLLIICHYFSFFQSNTGKYKVAFGKMSVKWLLSRL